MKKNRLLPKPILVSIILLVLANYFPQNIAAQYYKKRTYANFQGVYRTGLFATNIQTVFGSVTNASQAADNNPQTASTLNIPLGLVGTATVTQFLEFTTNGSHSTVRNLSAGTAVTVKFKVPSSILGLLDGVEIGSYSGLNAVSQSISGPLAFLGTGSGNTAGYNATNMYPAYTGATLLNALNGAGELELTFSPAQIFNGIYFKLSGNALSVALTSELFHAYILEDAPINCTTMNEVIDVLSGVKGNALVNAISATGSVTSPWNAVDDDPTYSTYATISTGAQVLSNVFETVIFETPSAAGDSIKLIIQDPGGGLLNLAALNGFTIQPYLGNTPVGTPITNSSSFLSLQLLPGSSNKYELNVAVPVSFDRIEIKMGGVTNALSQLRIYDIERNIVAPVITNNSTVVTNDTVFVNYGNSLMLDANSANTADSIRWYDDNGNLVGSGTSYYIPSVIEEGWYYAESARNGCSQTSASHAVYVRLLSTQMMALVTRARATGNQALKYSISAQNPVSDKLVVNFSGLNSGKYRMEIISINGRIVHQEFISINAVLQSAIIPRSGSWISGFYFLNIYNAQNLRLQTFKLVYR